MEMVPKSVYAEFGSKDDLFIAAIDHYAKVQTARYERLLGGDPAGIERVEDYFRGFAEWEDRRGCLLVNVIAERDAVPKMAVHRAQSFFDWLAKVYERNLRASKRRGDLGDRADVTALASALVVFDQGLAIACKAGSRVGDLSSAGLALLRAVRGMS